MEPKNIIKVSYPLNYPDVDFQVKKEKPDNKKVENILKHESDAKIAGVQSAALNTSPPGSS